MFTIVIFFRCIFTHSLVVMIISEADYLKLKVNEVRGRYVVHEHIQDFLNNLNPIFKVEEIGFSVEQKTIQSITFGKGSKRILMWSQMHGNESTTTKAVLDFINLIQLQLKSIPNVLEECTFKIIPILNPDGAKAYTRSNANMIDLNRDAQDLSQPESRILRNVYEFFKPHYCFNLHDQRTIFNVGLTNKPATVSFLAPAFDVDRNISSSRKESMLLIAAMNKTLQELIPGQVGRYDDAFNPNCVGDAFQMSDTPTILFEAGHFVNDYDREQTRKLIFQALGTAVKSITTDSAKNFSIADYHAIPENNKLFCDVLIKNVGSISSVKKVHEQVKILYKEVLEDDEILFVPTIVPSEASKTIQFGHKVLDCEIKEDIEWLAEERILELIN